MKALRNIEVEPLGEQRWLKIERSLMARAEHVFLASPALPKSRARRWAPAVLVAAALSSAVAVSAFVMREPAQQATLHAPSRIATGANGSHLALPGLALDVGVHSEVVVGAETAQGLLIVLHQGSIVCEVAPRAKDKPLIVQAGGTRVRVLGTRFSVLRVGETARVAVEHGVVEVLSVGGKWRVQAGQEWPAPSPRASAIPSSASAPSAAPSAEERAATGSSRSAAQATRERIGARSRTLAPPAASTAEVAAVQEPRNSEPVLSRQQLFERATTLERGDPARALQLYSSLEAGADSWAQNALYAHGRLEAALGNRAAARRLLAQYLERFPRGINAEDARTVLQRLR